MQFDPTQPMALFPDAVTELVGIAQGKIATKSIPSAYGINEAGLQVSEPTQGMIAVVPLWGPLTPSGDWGGTSLDDFARLMRSLDNNPNVTTIVLNTNTPGGTVAKTPEAAAAVRAVRDNGKTKIVAVVNSMMASAGTWIASGASEIVITPSGEAGSIGVICMYADWSKAYESAGIKVDVMRVPAGKARFSGIEPLTDEMRQIMQGKLQLSYEQFKRAVADNRNIRIDQVEKKFGGGEMMDAQAAVDSGLVDRIGTLDETLAKLMTRRAPSNARAQLAKAML